MRRNVDVITARDALQGSDKCMRAIRQFFIAACCADFGDVTRVVEAAWTNATASFDFQYQSATNYAHRMLPLDWYPISGGLNT
jgi:hypothetical protein